MTDKERFKRSEQWRDEVMKGDVAKDKCEFFKREDFESGGAFQTVLGISGPKVVECQVAAHTANRLLAEKSTRVYWNSKDESGKVSPAKSDINGADTTALTICIEPIQRDTAESLLRELIQHHEGSTHSRGEWLGYIERARKLLAKQAGEGEEEHEELMRLKGTLRFFELQHARNTRAFEYLVSMLPEECTTGFVTHAREIIAGKRE